MLIIEVQTPAFSGRFFNDPELNLAAALQARRECSPGLDEIFGFLQLSLIDRRQIASFRELTTSQAQAVWAEFCATKPTRWEIPNEVPAWL